MKTKTELEEEFSNILNSAKDSKLKRSAEEKDDLFLVIVWSYKYRSSQIEEMFYEWAGDEANDLNIGFMDTCVEVDHIDKNVYRIYI